MSVTVIGTQNLVGQLEQLAGGATLVVKVHPFASVIIIVLEPVDINPAFINGLAPPYV
jgi:hypothetical protein